MPLFELDFRIVLRPNFIGESNRLKARTFYFDFRGQNNKPIQRFPSYKPKRAIIFLIESKVPCGQIPAPSKTFRGITVTYGAAPAGISDFSCAEVLRGGAPIASHCYHILVYIPDLVVVLTTWYLF